MVTPISSNFSVAAMTRILPKPTKLTTVAKLSDIVDVPFEHTNVIELDQDLGVGVSSLAFLFAKSDTMQTGAQILMSSLPDQGFEAIASLYSFALYGILTSDYFASQFHYDKDCGLYVGGATDETSFGDISDAQLFRHIPIRFMYIDDEIIGFGSATPVGTDGYYINKILRGLFNTPIQNHKAGTQVIGGLTDACTCAVAGTGTYYFKIVPMNYLGNPMDSSNIEPIAVTIFDKSRCPLRPARLQAVRAGNNIALSWIPRVRGYGGAGYLSPELSIDLDPPYFSGHFAYSLNDGPKRVVTEPYLDVTLAGAATAQVWQRDNGVESDGIKLNIPNVDGTYFTN